MTENGPTYAGLAGPKLLFCKQCRGLKVDDRDYCCYCVGRDEIKNSSFRIRMICRLFSSQWKYWFIFHLGHDRHEALIPEHLRKGEWLDIEQINAPIRVDEE